MSEENGTHVTLVGTPGGGNGGAGSAPNVEVVEVNGQNGAPGPSPADLAKQKDVDSKTPRNPDEYEAEIAKLRKENAGWRTKYREAEPIVQKHRELEEAQKTEVQRAQEALEQERREKAELQTGYTRLELAAQYNIPPGHIDLIGSGSREEMEDRASRLSALAAIQQPPTARPPSDRPVEGLRPGASPEPPKPEDNSYPAEWGFQPQRQS